MDGTREIRLHTLGGHRGNMRFTSVFGKNESDMKLPGGLGIRAPFAATAVGDDFRAVGWTAVLPKTEMLNGETETDYGEGGVTT